MFSRLIVYRTQYLGQVAVILEHLYTIKFRVSRLSEVRFKQVTETGLDDIKYLVIQVAEAVDSD